MSSTTAKYIRLSSENDDSGENGRIESNSIKALADDRPVSGGDSMAHLPPDGSIPQTNADILLELLQASGMKLNTAKR